MDLHDFKSKIYLLNLLFQKRKTVEWLHNQLVANGTRTCAVYGSLSHSQREQQIGLFWRGSCNVMIATDIFARGISIPNVRIVVNFDIPIYCKSPSFTRYLHRIGRSAHAGCQSVAINLMKDLTTVVKIENHFQRKIDQI